MMRRIISHSNGNNLKTKSDFPNQEDFVSVDCAKGKLILRPSYLNVIVESPIFLERIHGDMCGLVNRMSRPFRYFMVLIDTSSRWSTVCLLSTRNHAFAQLIFQIIQLNVNFPNNRCNPSEWHHIMIIVFRENSTTF
jgi:hypothetical protein